VVRGSWVGGASGSRTWGFVDAITGVADPVVSW